MSCVKYPITEKFKKLIGENLTFKSMTITQKTKTLDVFSEIKEENRYININIILELIKKEIR
jgi:hypothetical protein